MLWRDIQALSPKFQQIPLQSLWRMWKDGKVFPKYKNRETRKRIRLVAQVTEAEYNAVKAAAECEGETMAEYIRRILSHAP